MLYVARFSFDQVEKEKDDQTGSFDVLLDAESAENATNACKDYLTKVVQKNKRDVFGGKVTMYLQDVHEVKVPLSRPALINFRCHPADGFSELINGILDGPSEVTAYRWGDREAEDEEQPFMVFEPGPIRVRMDSKPRKRVKSNRK